MTNARITGADSISPSLMVTSDVCDRGHMAGIYMLAAAVEVASEGCVWVVVPSRYGVSIETITESSAEIAHAVRTLRIAAEAIGLTVAA